MKKRSPLQITLLAALLICGCGAPLHEETRPEDLPTEEMSGDAGVESFECGSPQLISRNQGGGVGNAFSLPGGFTPDGRFLVFRSSASDLVTGDLNEVEDIFLYDFEARLLKRVSLSASGQEVGGRKTSGGISDDGEKILFWAESDDFLEEDSNGHGDLFLLDLKSGAISLVSVGSDGVQGDGGSSLLEYRLSSDGNKVFFLSLAANMTGDLDENRDADLFLRDMEKGTTHRLSRDLEGGVLERGVSRIADISLDGRQVAYTSNSHDLVADDPPEGDVDVLVIYVLDTGESRVAVRNDKGDILNHTPSNAAFGPDGTLYFVSLAWNLETEGLWGGPYRVHPDDGVIEVLIPEIAGADGASPLSNLSISRDGRILAFNTMEEQRPEGDLYLYHLETKELVNVVEECLPHRPDSPLIQPLLSEDGRRLVFSTKASNLAPNDNNQHFDIFSLEISWPDLE